VLFCGNLEKQTEAFCKTESKNKGNYLPHRCHSREDGNLLPLQKQPKGKIYTKLRNKGSVSVPFYNDPLISEHVSYKGLAKSRKKTAGKLPRYVFGTFR